MVQFPDYSDLAKVSNATRGFWDGEISIREKYRSYYEGKVFKEKVPLDGQTDDDAPELYPVGINLAKLLCLSCADSLWGEWEEKIVSFEPPQDGEVPGSMKDAVDLASTILKSSQANSLLWEVGLDTNIYGGSPVKISFSPGTPGRIRWTRIPIEHFFPVWDPENIDELLEVYILSEITREQARARYGITTDKDTVVRLEHWNWLKYENFIDGRRIDQFSGQNPWGFVPVEYVPRMRTTHWYGDSLVEDVTRPQDELNMRIADLGEAVNFNTHPIKYGYNLPKAFNARNYPIGPGLMWDLGRVIGQSPEPKVGLLEAQNPIPQGTFDYIKFIYDWTRTSVFAPPIAFGEDNGGGQRSGITLEIRMWPLVKATRRARSYMGDALVRLLRKSALILKQKALSETPKRALEHMINGELAPRFAPLMPRDQAAIIDEVVKGLANEPPTISLETSVKKLGYGTAEVERIKQMLADDELYSRQEKMEQQKLDAQMKISKTRGMNSGAGSAPDKERNE